MRLPLFPPPSLRHEPLVHDLPELLRQAEDDPDRETGRHAVHVSGDVGRGARRAQVRLLGLRVPGHVVLLG